MSTELLQRAVRANLIEHTLAGVCNTLSRVFSAKSGVCGRNILVLPVANPDALEAALRDRAEKSPTGQIDMYALPVVGVTLSEVTEQNDQGSLNKTAMQRVGYSLGVEDHGQYFVVLRGKSIKVTYQVTFLTDDYGTMLRMIDAWFSYTQWRFSLRLRETRKSIKVQMTPDQALSVPPRSPGSSGADQYRLTTNLAASTYSGSLWKIPSIAKTTMQYIVGGKSIETALEEGGIEIVDAIDRLSASNITTPVDVGNSELGVFEEP